jgi:hypothetical protein
MSQEQDLTKKKKKEDKFIHEFNWWPLSGSFHGIREGRFPTLPRMGVAVKILLLLLLCSTMISFVLVICRKTRLRRERGPRRTSTLVCRRHIHAAERQLMRINQLIKCRRHARVIVERAREKKGSARAHWLAVMHPTACSWFVAPRRRCAGATGFS